jgi:hypothetical protein
MFSKRMPLIVASAAVLCAGSVDADTIKVGVIGPFSGPFAIAPIALEIWP